MEAQVFLCLALFIVMVVLPIYASDPNMLQDFCVASNDPDDTLFINGLLCKNPTLVTADDFIFRGLNTPVIINERDGLNATVVTPSNLPGLNTMGLSMLRTVYEPNGISSPHNHPLASELTIVLEGTLYVGFVSGTNKLYSKVLNPGDVFIFPQGLVHFLFNIGKTNAVMIAAYNSQDIGGGVLADKLFGSKPSIPVDVLSKAFQLDPKIVEDLQSKF